MSLETELLEFAQAIGADVKALLARGQLPIGGAANQVLRKKSATAFDVEWANAVDAWTWAKLAADAAANSTVTLASTGLSIAVLANTTYLVEAVGCFTAAATTTGIALGLDIPSGVVVGLADHPISTTATNSVEQVADNATTGATTGVRAAATLVPFRGSWVVEVGATAGNIVLMARSEVASSAIQVKKPTLLGLRAV